jgi:aminobenzoyl-glutamate utilization protein B
LAECAALSNLTPAPDSFAKEAPIPGAPGHGCGHNLLGAGSLAAAMAVKEYLRASGGPGTVVYYGCPGEEGGSGKSFMARDGVFDELDCAITWHPGDLNSTGCGSSLANIQAAFRFYGVSAHAAASPHLGRSALDAVELMNVGVQFLREHVVADARIHYAITDAGGFSPNVVQPFSEVLYLIRAPKTPQVREIFERVSRIAGGAAQMTDTRMEAQFVKACSNIVPNRVLAQALQRSLEQIAPPDYTPGEWEYARRIAGTVENSADSLDAVCARLDKPAREFVRSRKGKGLNDFVVPFCSVEDVMPASSDVGDVSWVCPTAQISAVTMAANTPGHSWQLVAQGKSALAHKGMLYAGKVMAAAVMDLLQRPEMIEEAKEELHERLGGKPFAPPTPKENNPWPIPPRPRRCPQFRTGRRRLPAALAIVLFNRHPSRANITVHAPQKRAFL